MPYITENIISEDVGMFNRVLTKHIGFLILVLGKTHSTYNVPWLYDKYEEVWQIRVSYEQRNGDVSSDYFKITYNPFYMTKRCAVCATDFYLSRYF